MNSFSFPFKVDKHRSITFSFTKASIPYFCRYLLLHNYHYCLYNKYDLNNSIKKPPIIKPIRKLPIKVIIGSGIS